MKYLSAERHVQAYGTSAANLAGKCMDTVKNWLLSVKSINETVN